MKFHYEDVDDVRDFLFINVMYQCNLTIKYYNSKSNDSIIDIQRFTNNKNKTRDMIVTNIWSDISKIYEYIFKTQEM